MRISIRTVLAAAVATVVSSSLVLSASTAQATPREASAAARVQSTAASAEALSAPVTGSFTDASGAPGTFVGTFTPTHFDADEANVIATGTLVGTLTDSAGTQLGSVTQTISTPLDRSGNAGASTRALAAPSCQILDLRLQPLDLDLLGLRVHLDTVHLNITAVPGAGNLLGNLLCAVTGLLDGAGALAQIAALLNQILAILNGL